MLQKLNLSNKIQKYKEFIKSIKIFLIKLKMKYKNFPINSLELEFLIYEMINIVT